MKLRKIAALIGDLVVPPHCVGCKCSMEPRYGGASPLCSVCESAFRKELWRRCPICGKPMIECRCAPTAERGLEPVYKLCAYIPSSAEDISAQLIYRLKCDRNPALCDYLAHMLAERVLAERAEMEASELVVTYVPRSSSRVKAVGFDHAALLARALARELDVPFVRALRNVGVQTQKNLGGAERWENAEASFQVRRGVCLADRRVLLVDDITTTGATLAACKACLCSAGAEKVYPICIGMTGKRVTEREKTPIL